jgi:mRNA-degrading endonuclease toxin of MazEF toxin-antitoxin module
VAEPAELHRGDVWWCHFGTLQPHRVVLLSRDSSYVARGRATVALIRTRVRGIPVEVDVTADLDLGERSVINVDELPTVSARQLRDRVGALADSTLAAVEIALHYALGLRS